tara:strand:+ start:8197 stop:11913 length:3717 start_codon:yes stop_codon:yes gene_type:complete
MSILFADIFPDLKNKTKCAKDLAAQNPDKLREAEDLSHKKVLSDLSVRIGRYFDFFGILDKPSGNPNLSQLKAGRDITIEHLISFGLSSDLDPTSYKATTLKDLLDKFSTSRKKQGIDFFASESGHQIGGIIRKLNEIAITGARNLGRYQTSKGGKAGFNLDFRDINSALGLPIGFGGQDGGLKRGDKDFIKALTTFLDQRIGLVTDKITNQQEREEFNKVLLIALSTRTGTGQDIFNFLANPAVKGPFALRGQKVKIDQHGTKSLAIWLSATPQSPLGFKNVDVANKTKDFIKAILKLKLVIDNSGTMRTYENIFLEKFKLQCEALNADDVDSAENKFPAIGSELELKRKRLQNIRCILPMFEDLYSSNSSPALATDGLTGVYSKNYKHTLNSSNASKASNQSKFYTADQHPLIFAYTKDSHFFVNKLFNRGGNNKTALKTFLEATNTDISFLQPRIRVYKVLESPEGKEIEIPMEFSNKIELTKSSGVYERENAGIERVRIRRTGQTPATFDKLIDVNIRLVFDSINAFTKCRGHGKKKYSYVDFLRRPVELNPTDDQINKIKTAASALQPPAKSSKGDLEKFIRQTQQISLDSYNPEKFQIKLEVGWSFNDQVYQGQTAGRIHRRRLQEFINETNLVLYLHLQTHDFTFRNDGTVNLDVRYMGRAGSQLIDAFQTNIFHTPHLAGLHKSVSVIDDMLSFDRKNKNKQININVSYLQKQKNRLIQKLDTERSELTSQIWKRLVDAAEKGSSGKKITFIEPVGSTPPPTHFLKLTMPDFFVFFNADIIKKLDLVFTKDQIKNLKKTAKSRLVNTSSLLSYYRNLLLSGDLKPEDQIKLDIIAKDDDIAKNITPKGKTSGPDKGAEKGDPLRPEDFESQLGARKFKPNEFKKTYLKSSKKDSKVDMYCLRYGSIIHSAVQNIWQFNPDGLKDIVIMLAPSRFTSIDGKTTKHFNFADIPILFEDWKRFMIDKVVNKRKVNYAFIDFLRDSIIELLIPAMGALNTGCKDGTQIASPLRGIKPRLTSFSARRQSGLKPSDGRVSVSLDEKNASLLVGNNLVGKSNIVDTSPELKHFLVIYDAGMSTSAKLEGTGRKPKLYDKHLHNNIPHIFIGANKGMMRSISFRKSTVPFFQESKVLDRGDTDFGLLREKYDCTLEIIGNPHFHQGMRFYLDPTFTGMSEDNVDVVQGVLGLGGYYDIVDVTSDISKSGFKTNIVGSWQAFRDGYDSNKRRTDPCKDK